MTFADADVVVHLGESAPLIVGTGTDGPGMAQLHTVGIEARTVTIQSGDQTLRRLTDVAVQLTKQAPADGGSGPEWQLTANLLDEGVATTVSGVVLRSRSANDEFGPGAVRFAGDLQRPDGQGQLQFALGMPPNGPLEFDLRAQPSLDGIDVLHALGHTDNAWAQRVDWTGQVRLAGPDLDSKTNVTAAVNRPGGDGPPLMLAGATMAAGLGGRASGLLRARLNAGGRLEIWGELFAEDIELPRAAAAVGRTQPDHGRLVRGETAFYLDGLTMDDVQAQGMLFFDDVAVGEFPVVRELARAISPGRQVLTDDSDALMLFSLDQNVLTIHVGRVVDLLTALNTEDGSTINLATREVDLRVSAALVSDLQPILQLLPVVNWAATIADSLVHMNVTGTWDDPVVTPAAERIVTSNAVGFVQAMMGLGGNWGALLLDGGQDLFGVLLADDEAAPAPPWPPAPNTPTMPDPPVLGRP
jgi:hypothetical protein